MPLTVADFAEFHAAVHTDRSGSAKRPFDWQNRLLAEIVAKRGWPRLLDLPTGSGKTTCVDIALFALALDAQNPESERWCPRRIAMVVDRRLVVDQVAERGRLLLRALTNDDAPPIVKEVANHLRNIGSEKDPISVFTLRGGIPKDDGWARSPTQPLILASTVDQIGSRLLIQGYGVSDRMKPVHAGLLGNDLLLLLDEVHLSQPFAETLAALERLRPRESPLSSAHRFHHSLLSATPGTATNNVFRLTPAERSIESPLGPRLHVSKPARRRVVSGRPALEDECAKEATSFLKRHDTIAVVVNRIASARAIATTLRKSLDGIADVYQLTGRMRPLDRDDILNELRPRVMVGRNRSDVERKLVVVATQCIEAGADFDVDALVSEAASLDALRQRFGRLDRLGEYGKAEALIVRDKSEKDDPIYGEAIKATCEWLFGTASVIDFGIERLTLPDLSTMEPMLPKSLKSLHAPTLLPAYMDLWMQTSPPPKIGPDVSLWLHGPESGPADVQVIWRADLTEETFQARDVEALRNIVSSVRPVGLEALALPFATARQWLSGTAVDDVGDVEGASPQSDEVDSFTRALRWRGDDSDVITARDLRPGDTIVIPCSRGGIKAHNFDPDSREPVQDLAERAAFFGRGKPVLRLHPTVLAQYRLAIPAEDLADTREALAIAATTERPAWEKLWLERVSRSRSLAVVNADERWAVLEGRRVDPQTLRNLLTRLEDVLEDGMDLTTDDDDAVYLGAPVLLSRHSMDVERKAREFARACGLPAAIVEDIALAGWLHDIGKADPRFQLLLRGGDAIEWFKDEALWAKSNLPAAARDARLQAQRRSGYPSRSRHEVQSVAMAHGRLDVIKGKATDVDLVLHLVASHHGHCRPFAPVVADDDPCAVSLPAHHSDEFGAASFGPLSSDHGLHRLDAPLADRFWSLVEKYGWHGLCWMEAILRLADHRASEAATGDDRAS